MTFRAMPLGAIKPKGWIKAQLKTDLEIGFASRLDQLTAHAANDLFQNRMSSSQEQIAWWDSETRGNWLWGYTMAAHLAEQDEFIAHSSPLMETLKNTQDADGYIGIYSPAWRFQHPAGENGELWGQSRALLALLAHYELTQDTSYLDSVERAVQLTIQQYGNQQRYFSQPDNPTANLTGLTHGLCYMDVAAWLYRITGKTAYRDFGLWLFADFNRMRVPFDNDDMALANLRDPHRHFSGHAVHTAEHLRCVIWAAAHDSSYQDALTHALHKVQRYLLPSGAMIGDEGIHGLPTPDSGYEYCTLTELLLSFAVGLETLGSAEFGDWIETLAFNAAQGARTPDGTGVSYLTCDTRLSATQHRPDSYSYLHGSAGRFKISPTHEDIACCCNPNAVRLMPHYISHMWLHHPEGIAAVLYGPCQLHTTFQGINVHIEEITDYPFDNTITFILHPERPIRFALLLRIPAWQQGINLESPNTDIQRQDGYMVLQKEWTKGDTIRVTFESSVELKPYPTGDYSIHYGALQFVLPIAHHKQEIKSYPLAGFHDYDILPVTLSEAYDPIILDASRPHYGFSVAQTGDFSWQTGGIHLHGYDKIFIPLGATILRRAAFPLYANRRY